MLQGYLSIQRSWSITAAPINVRALENLLGGVLLSRQGRNSSPRRKLTARVAGQSTLAGESFAAEDRLHGSALCATHGKTIERINRSYKDFGEQRDERITRR